MSEVCAQQNPKANIIKLAGITKSALINDIAEEYSY